MPIKLNKPKTKQIACAKIPGKEYRILVFYKKTGMIDNDGNEYQPIKKYQVQKNRKKIANFKVQEIAIRRMIAEINYELNNLFT